MAPEIALRRYMTEDLDAVIEVFQRAIREVSSRDYNPAQIAAWSTVDRDAWEPHRLTRPTWVAVDGARVVGFSDLEDDGHLDMMFVHPVIRASAWQVCCFDRWKRRRLNRG